MRLQARCLTDLMTEPLGKDSKGQDVFIGDVWPTTEEVNALLKDAMNPRVFESLYSKLTTDGDLWSQVPSASGQVYNWPSSTYIAEPPFFGDFAMQNTISKAPG